MLFPKARLNSRFSLIFINMLVSLLSISCSSVKVEKNNLEESLEKSIVVEEPQVREVQTSNIVKDARIHIRAENVFIDNYPRSWGEYLSISAGEKTITFQSNLKLPKYSEKNNTVYTIEDNIENLKFLGCVAFLPLCAISGSNIFSEDYNPGKKKERQVEHIESSCEIEAVVTLKQDNDYAVKIEMVENSEPLLIVDNIYKPPYRIFIEKMTCVDVKS